MCQEEYAQGEAGLGRGAVRMGWDGELDWMGWVGLGWDGHASRLQPSAPGRELCFQAAKPSVATLQPSLQPRASQATS